MQNIENTIRTASNGRDHTLNEYGGAWHSRLKQYVDYKQWMAAEGRVVRVRHSLHRTARGKWVNGFGLTVGEHYVACYATAARAKDLVKWAIAKGYPADILAKYNSRYM